MVNDVCGCVSSSVQENCIGERLHSSRGAGFIAMRDACCLALSCWIEY